jgi:hypothetical protein
MKWQRIVKIEESGNEIEISGGGKAKMAAAAAWRKTMAQQKPWQQRRAHGIINETDVGKMVIGNRSNMLMKSNVISGNGANQWRREKRQWRSWRKNISVSIMKK